MTKLLLDFDGRLPRDFAQRLRMLCELHRVHVCYVQRLRSGSGRGWHVIIGIRERMSFLRIVCCQSILGSDWKRELYNSRRAIAWRRVPAFWRERANVLYVRHHREIEL